MTKGTSARRFARYVAMLGKIALLTLGSACDDEPAPILPIDEADWPAEVAKFECKQRSACDCPDLESSDEDSCVDDRTDYYTSLRDRMIERNFVYDAPCLSRSLEFFRDLGCEGLDARRHRIRTDKYFPRCRIYSRDGQAGDPCERFADWSSCGPQLRCDQTNHCVAVVARSLVGEDEVCYADFDRFDPTCHAGLECTFAYTPNVCVPPIPVGDACGIGDDRSCGFEAYCDYAAGVCAPRIVEGVCSQPWECESGVCNDGTCEPAQAAVCYAQWELELREYEVLESND